MKVYELKVKVFLLKDIASEDVQNSIAKFIDSAMAQDNELASYHYEKHYKNYTFDGLYPLEKDKLYKKENIYSYRIRTINLEFAQYILEKVKNFYNQEMKALTVEVREVPKKIIEKIYTITPILLKNDGGYWKYSIGMDGFEKRLTDNIIKKYKYFSDATLNEDFLFYNSITFINKKPVPIKYKNITLRGDKIELQIANDPHAQELAYLAIGLGLGENNARGCGFVGYRFL